jgi:hypothetical protein
LASWTIAGLMMRSDSLSIFSVRSEDVNLKSTPFCLSTARRTCLRRRPECSGRAVADGEVGRAADGDGVANRVAVDLVVELFLVAAIDEIAHHAVVFEDIRSPPRQ